MDPASLRSSLLEDLSSVPARRHYEGATRSVLATVWRFKVLVLGVTCLALALSVAALGVLGKSYASDALIQINTDRPRDATLADAAVQAETTIIRSRAVAQRVVDRLALPDRARLATQMLAEMRTRAITVPKG